MRNGQNKERCLARVVGGGCVVLAMAGCGVGGEMGRGLKATHATGRAEGVSDLEEGGVGYCSVMVFVDQDLGTGSWARRLATAVIQVAADPPRQKARETRVSRRPPTKTSRVLLQRVSRP